jgi:hypothetical protein
MGKSTPSPPSAPDPFATAAAQSASNRETAMTQAALNRVNQNTPFGNLTWARNTATPGGAAWQSYDTAYTNWLGADPATRGNAPSRPEVEDSWTVNQTLNPASQRFLDTTQNIANTQLSRVSDALGQPFDPSRIGPARVDRLDGRYLPQFQSGVTAGPLMNTVNTSRGLVYDPGDAGGVARGFDDVGNVARGFGDVGGVTRGVEGAGPITWEPMNAGSIQSGVGFTNQIADVGQARGSIDMAGLGDPNISRDRVENALLSRINPQLDRDRQALEQRLVNQGVTPGSPAWARAQEEFGRNVNDARYGAIVGGGQEQSRLFGLGLNQTQLGNQAQAQNFGQAATRAGFFNDANLTGGNFANAAQRQQFEENIARAGFANQAQGQQFGQNVTQAQFSNQAQQQAFDQEQARAAFGNSAQQQSYNQALGRATFGNQAQQQVFDQLMGRAGFNNQTQGLEFGQNMDRGNFFNAAQAQQFGQGVTNANLNNSVRAQGYNELLNNANFTNSARQNAISEALLARQMPINEMNALISGNGLQQPNFVNTPATQIQPTDVAGPIYQNYQGALNNYNQQVGSRNAAMGGLFGLGGAAAGGWARAGFPMPSDIRLKTDISRVGTLDNGLPVYSYRYKSGGPMQIGVMAQDVETVNPAAVVEIGGFKHVDYAEAVQ